MKYFLMNTTALRSPEGLGGFGGSSVGGQSSDSSATGAGTQDVTSREGDVDNRRPGQNNTGNNDDILADLWGSTRGESAGERRQENSNQQNSGQNSPNVDPQDQIKRHFESIGLGDFTLSADERQQLVDGNPDAVMNRINERMQNMYIQTMRSINTLLERSVGEAVTRANQNTADQIAAGGFRTRLYDAVPFAKDPIISPVAEGVARKLFERGFSESEVIDGVKEYFARISKASGDMEGSPNSNFNGNYNTRRGNDKIDWLELLTEK